MKTFALLAAGLVGCAALGARADEKAPKIEGTYKLVAGKKNGADADEGSKKAKYVIDAKKITIGDGDAKFVMSYKLDGAKIDMEILDAPIPDLKGTKGYGIVEAKGDTLKLAYALEKDKRPKDFSGKDGFYFELKKDKAK
jgi:uncharacterized protein (TIGR03067 family)